VTASDVKSGPVSVTVILHLFNEGMLAGCGSPLQPVVALPGITEAGEENMCSNMCSPAKYAKRVQVCCSTEASVSGTVPFV